MTSPFANIRRFLALSLAFGIWTASAQSQVLVVAPADPAAFDQIQDAVDAAAPGDIIKVHAGTYGRVVIATPGLTLEEADVSSDPVIEVITPFMFPPPPGGLGLDIQADDVTVRGLDVHVFPHPFFLDGTGIRIQADGVTVRDCDVLIDRGTGVDIQGDGVIVRDCEVRKTGGLTTGFSVAGDGNTLSGNAAFDHWINYSISTTDSMFSNNLAGAVPGNSFRGFLESGGSGNSFVANVATDMIGFEIANSSGTTLTANQVVRSLSSGFYVNGSDGLSCTGNLATDCANAGFRLDGCTNSRFAGDRGEDNTNNGFDLIGLGNTGNLFTGIVLRENGGYAVWVEPTSTNDNEFVGVVSVNNGLGTSNVEL